MTVNSNDFYDLLNVVADLIANVKMKPEAKSKIRKILKQRISNIRNAEYERHLRKMEALLQTDQYFYPF